MEGAVRQGITANNRLGLVRHGNLESQKLARQKPRQLPAIVRREVKGRNIIRLLDFGDNLKFSKTVPGQFHLFGFDLAPGHYIFDLHLQQLRFKIDFFLSDGKNPRVVSHKHQYIGYQAQ